MKPLSRRKRILFSIIAAAFGLVLLEGALQLFYRATAGSWLWEWWATPIFEADPIRVYKVKGNLDYSHKTTEYSVRYITNPLGMRTDEQRAVPAIPKPDGVFRILSLGPSFAFGSSVNYEDSYIYKIARGLTVPGKTVELVNLGTPSQPPRYQLRWLKREGFRYQPDLIIQTVYGGIQGIDTDDSLPEIVPGVRDGYLYPSTQMTAALWIRRLRRYSAVLFYGWHAYQALLGPKKEAAGDGREFYRKVDAPKSTEADDCVRSYRQYLDFVHGALSKKPPVVFLYIPLSYVVRPADVSRFAHHGNTLNPLDSRTQSAALAQTLNTNGITLVDPTEILVDGDKTSRMYYLYDIHFTVAGNAAVSSYALPIIQQAINKHFLFEPREMIQAR